MNSSPSSTAPGNTPEDLPSIDEALVILKGALGQIRFSHEYLRTLIESVPHDRWFETPHGLPASIAWHVGHLAVSQYGLLMFRIRGRAEDDLELIPSRFRKAYGRGSVPSADPSTQPSPGELLEKLEHVYERALLELDTVTGPTLLEPVDMPYAAFPIKLGAILFCPLHEQVHAGHIGAIRRAMGLDPIR